MTRRLSFVFVLTAALLVGFDGHLSAVPLAPNAVAPADGGSLTEPFTISWSDVSDASDVWQAGAACSITFANERSGRGALGGSRSGSR